MVVSALALVGLVGAMCLGAFSAPQIAAPVMSRSAAVMSPSVMSGRMTHRTISNVQARAQQVTSNLAEVKKKAASGGRLGKIALLAVPVVAWVGFNILGPAQNQLEAMKEENEAKSAPKKPTRRRGVSFPSFVFVFLILS